MKDRSRKKDQSRGKKNVQKEETKIMVKEDGQEYGQVLKFVNGRRVLVKCVDGQERLCIIRKKEKKGSKFIVVGDYVLISLREFTDNISDVVYKYNNEQVKEMKRKGVLPDGDYVERPVNYEDLQEEEDGFIFEEL